MTKVKLEQKQKEGIAEARSGRRGPVRVVCADVLAGPQVGGGAQGACQLIKSVPLCRRVFSGAGVLWYQHSLPAVQLQRGATASS